jgi:hypothetical protein
VTSNFNRMADAVRPVLIEAARRYRALVSYQQLAAAVEQSDGALTSQPVHRWIGRVLEAVARDCESRGEPLLISLCVNVQRSVGEVYADAVERVRGSRPEDPDEHAATERLECYRHWEAAGLPADGGTPLRTAHFKVVRKPASRATTPRTTPRKRAAARPPAAAPAPKPIALCPTCFTAVPATGVCDYCD